MFDVDPDEFVFGNDFNNNTIPDFREDDMKKLLDSVILKRGDNFLRVISLCSGAICGILLWIAITGMLAK